MQVEIGPNKTKETSNDHYAVASRDGKKVRFRNNFCIKNWRIGTPNKVRDFGCNLAVIGEELKVFRKPKLEKLIAVRFSTNCWINPLNGESYQQGSIIYFLNGQTYVDPA